MSFSLKIRTAEARAAEMAATQQARIVAAVEQQIESQARALGYGSAAALAGYAGSSVDLWAMQARAFVTWRDAVWTRVFARLANENTTDTLTPASVIADLPAWPQ